MISNDIDAAPLNVAIPKPYTPGNNISIDENNRISAVITAYTPGEHISIENNEISATYGNATTSTAGLMSPDDKFKLDGLAEGFGYYSIVQSNTDGHKFSLIKKAGESDPGETVSNIEIPDNDHRYDLSFDLSSRKLSLIEKVNESDANGVTIKQVTIPDSNTNYVLQIFDHELYMFTAAQYEEYSALELDVAKAEYLQHNEAELNHITIPDFNNSYTAGTGIEISDDGTISTTNAVRTLIYKVDELPTSNVDKEAIYVLKPQSGNDPATYKLFMDFSSEEDQEPIWKELGKQENEIEEATDDDISDLFASDDD